MGTRELMLLLKFYELQTTNTDKLSCAIRFRFLIIQTEFCK